MTYRPHLDGIRAIAVLAVVLYHAHMPGFPGGFVGVDVFFVISGYLITGMLLQELEQTGDLSIRRFVERRIRRLTPALFVVLVATLIAGTALLTPIGGEVQGMAKSAMAAVLLFANYYFYAHSGNYFDPPPYTLPLLHTWSLSVEEQFYVVWPWLLLATGWYAARRKAPMEVIVATVMISVAFFSLAACAWVTRSNQPMAFYATPFRAWEFAAGALVFLSLRWRRPVPRFAEAVAFVGFAAIATSVALFTDTMAFPGWIAALPVLGSCGLIYGSEQSPGGIAGRALSARPMVWLGLLSYSIYLWHWPVFAFTRSLLLHDFSPILGVALTLASIALAWLTWRFIEQPIRTRRSPLMSTRKRAFGIGAVATACVLAAGLGAGTWAKVVWPRLPGNAARAAQAIAIRRPDWVCSTSNQVRTPSGTDGGCLTGRDAPAHILLWGDSHAGQLMPVLAAAAREHNTVGLLRYRPSCPPAIGFTHEPEPDECVAFNDEVLRDVRIRRDLDTVILSARWIGYLDREQSQAQLEQRLERTVDALERSGVRVVLVASGVDFPWPVPACIVRRGEGACARTRSEAEARRANAQALIAFVAKAHPRVAVVDPMRRLCSTEICPVSLGGQVLYSDAHHLSQWGARLLVPVFLRVIAAEAPVAAGRPPAVALSRVSR